MTDQPDPKSPDAAGRPASPQLDSAEPRALLTPYRLNEVLRLSNRVVMAPMTRCLADDDLVPTEAMAAYYARRADAGLIVSEGAVIRPDGQGYPNTPGIFTDEQVQGWRRVTDQVHAAGGKIFLQLWHVGRVSHPIYLDGQLPVAPSAVALTGRIHRTKDLEYGTPRALDADEIPDVVDAYATGAANALAAGFDGVEIHGANGYLIDQFLHRHTNRRDDAYGRSTEDLARFALEVVDAVVARVGRERAGLRLSPGAYHHTDAHRDDPAVFRYLLGELGPRGLAYVHTGIFDDSTTFDYLDGTATAFLRRHYNGTVIGCGCYTPESGARAIAAGAFDLLALGRPFIANPDLITRIRDNAPLTPYADAMLKTLD
ncbi:MAG: alkene reductase [bacterium]|nr:alkene reductase [bacterium]